MTLLLSVESPTRLLLLTSDKVTAFEVQQDYSLTNEAGVSLNCRSDYFFSCPRVGCSWCVVFLNWARNDTTLRIFSPFIQVTAGQPVLLLVGWQSWWLWLLGVAPAGAVKWVVFVRGVRQRRRERESIVLWWETVVGWESRNRDWSEREGESYSEVEQRTEYAVTVKWPLSG